MNVPLSIDDVACIKTIAQTSRLRDYSIAYAWSREPERLLRIAVVHDGTHPDPREPGNEYFTVAYEVNDNQP